MSGSTAVGDKQGLAQYATFEMKRQDTRDGSTGDAGTMTAGMHDDRTPLNPTTRDPSVRSASTGRRPYGVPGDDAAPPMPLGGRQSLDSNPGAAGGRRPSRDAYGNPLIPLAGAAGVGVMANELRHHGSQNSLGSNNPNRGGGAYARGGRAGYGPPGRGGGGGYGPPQQQQRGGYGGPPPQQQQQGRGGYGPPGRGGMGMRGGQGPPPPGGWRGRGGGGG
ncbi:regulator of ime2, partial [Teratosphaeriaceae sp. CCFEE 6253]